jgi:hypothetical protein
MIIFERMQSRRINKEARLKLIERNGRLFWYVPEAEKVNISLEAMVEAILNYGDIEAVRHLIGLVGINTVAEIFFRQTRNKRVNYFPQVTNYYTLYFNRHAPGSTDNTAS